MNDTQHTPTPQHEVPAVTLPHVLTPAQHQEAKRLYDAMEELRRGAEQAIQTLHGQLLTCLEHWTGHDMQHPAVRLAFDPERGVLSVAEDA